VGALGGVSSGNTRPAILPGLGVEGFWGPIGLRLDGGDEIYFDHGARHNLKVGFGPVSDSKCTDFVRRPCVGNEAELAGGFIALCCLSRFSRRRLGFDRSRLSMSGAMNFLFHGWPPLVD